MKQKVRFFFANILDDIFPKSCWMALASWALGYREFEDIPFFKQCEFLDDRCYCGKQIVEKTMDKTLTLTNHEIEWLHALVAEQDTILRHLQDYPSYTTVHSARRKLDALVAEINEEYEIGEDNATP